MADDHEDMEMEEAGPTVSEEELKAAAETKDKEVTNLIGLSQTEKALQVALEDPPYLSKVAETKDVAAKAVLNAIGAIKDSEIDKVLGTMSLDQCDVLMKYIYRGLASDANAASLLKWHAKVKDKAGLGCIVRVLAERRNVGS
eukprot:GFYU01001682.1.p1 GENE.GFYU01001682.1~~GFYU01001682.1.p1  ORF type:complete len:143 (+),score=40.52 GFYU01001682.1:33-461(+)